MSNKFKNQLNQWSKQNNFPQHRKDTKKKEKLSQSDLNELMGIHRPTYKRGHGGSFKQK